MRRRTKKIFAKIRPNRPVLATHSLVAGPRPLEGLGQHFAVNSDHSIGRLKAPRGANASPELRARAFRVPALAPPTGSGSGGGPVFQEAAPANQKSPAPASVASTESESSEKLGRSLSETSTTNPTEAVRSKKARSNQTRGRDFAPRSTQGATARPPQE